MDLQIIKRLIRHEPLFYKEVNDYIFRIEDTHPLFDFLSEFPSIRTVFYLKNEELIDDQNPSIEITSSELYDFVIKHNLITQMNFIEQTKEYECIICMDDDIAYSIQKCGHIFHQRCILKWNKERNGVCPLCKYELFENAIWSWYKELNNK